MNCLFFIVLILPFSSAGNGLNSMYTLGQYVDGSALFFNRTYSPNFCSGASDTTTRTCAYSSPPALTSLEKSDRLAQLGCRACTQSRERRCSSVALSESFGRFSNIWAAWCNDDYIVVAYTQQTSSRANLDDIPLPPGRNDALGFCRTRSGSVTSGDNRIVAYSLCPSALSTSNATVNNFAVGAANGVNFFYGAGRTLAYTLPVDRNVGTTLEGQEIYPTFSSNLQYAPEVCEVDGCNEHLGNESGQVGGIPHLHGDPFGPNCFYNSLNYSSVSSHPPHLGYSLDGFLIYGRHLAENATGFSTPLDDCGGHIHSGFAYHYHTQVVARIASSAAILASFVGKPYMATTSGVFQCWKADLRRQPYFPFNASSDNVTFQYSKKPCCGSTAYYFSPSITLPSTNFGPQSTSAGNFTSACGVYTATSNSPTPTSSPKPDDKLKYGLGFGVSLGAVLVVTLLWLCISRASERVLPKSAKVVASSGATAGADV